MLVRDALVMEPADDGIIQRGVVGYDIEDRFIRPSSVFFSLVDESLGDGITNTELLDFAVSPLTSTAGALLELRTTGNLRRGPEEWNIGVLVMREVHYLEWRPDGDRVGRPLRAVEVLETRARVDATGRVLLDVYCVFDHVRVGFRGAELFLGRNPELAEIVPNYTEHSPRSLLGLVPGWDTEVSELARFALDPVALRFWPAGMVR